MQLIVIFLVLLISYIQARVLLTSDAIWQTLDVQSLNWVCIANSQSGQYVVAAADDNGIYVSSDSGNSWIISDAPASQWQGINVDGSGKYGIAAAVNDYLHISIDYGVSWTPVASSLESGWYDVTSNANSGSYAVAITNTQFIYYTSNRGLSFFQALNAPRADYYALTMSASGQYVYICTINTVVYTSSTYGLDWVDADIINAPWSTITSSGDGQRVVVAAFDGNIYISADFGITFSVGSVSSGFVWFSIVSDTTGQYLVALANQVYVSTDYGSTFTLAVTSPSGALQQVSCSGDGTSAYVIQNGGPIYLGYSPTPTPVLLPTAKPTTTDEGLLIETAWFTTQAPTLTWTCVASDSTGQYIYAPSISDGIYLSSDFGITFSSTSAPSYSWQSVTTSNNGQIAIVASVDAYLYITSNFGVSWSPTSTLANGWYDVTGSGTGQQIIACTNTRRLYQSLNYGSTFSQITTIPTASFYTLAMNRGSAQYLFVGSYGGYIYSSSNSGATWTTGTLSALWQCIDTSSTGQYVAAVVYDGLIYVSVNYGNFFVGQATSYGNRNWFGISLDSTGLKMVAIAEFVYVSGDAGQSFSQATNGPTSGGLQAVITNSDASYTTVVTYRGGIYEGTNTEPAITLNAIWQPFGPTLTWSCIATDSSGRVVVAGSYGAGVYISYNYGITWTLTSAPESNWQGIGIDSSGTQIVVVSGNDYIYIFKDSFGTWDPVGVGSLPIGYNDVACSANFQYIYALTTTSDNSLYYSNDFGGSFTLLTLPTSSSAYFSISCDSTGQYINVAESSGSLYYSNNYGISFGNFILTNSWVCIATSSEGSIVAVAPQSGNLYVSSDYGNSYALSGPNAAWSNIVVSATGQYITAITATNVYYSSNSGSTFNLMINNPTGSAFQAVASNALSSRVFVINYGGQVFEGSYDFTPYPTLAPTRSPTIFVSNSPTMSPSAESSNAPTIVFPLIDSIFTLTQAPVAGWSCVISDISGQYVVAGTSGIYGIWLSQDFAITWTQSTAPIFNWYAVASSYDGSTLTAVSPDTYIYVSRNFGSTWTSVTTAPSNGWYDVSSNGNGNYIVALTNSGFIYLSSNKGVLFNKLSAPSIAYYTVTIDLVGQHIVAGAYDGLIYNSADFGTTWNTSTVISSKWACVTTSGNGQYVYAAQVTGSIYLSTDYAVSFTQGSTNLNSGLVWYGVATDASGRYIVGVTDYVYISSDYGVTFQQSSSSPVGALQAVCTSGNNYFVTVVQYNGGIWEGTPSERPLTTDAIFVVEDAPRVAWSCVTTDITGQFIAAGSLGSGVYISSDYATTWTPVTILDAQWVDIVTDDLFTYIAIVSPETYVYLSIDSGSSWNPILVGPSQGSQAIAMSSTGQYITVASNQDVLYYSSNYGTSLSILSNSPDLTIVTYNCITTSASGQYVYTGTVGYTGVEVSDATIFYSSNFGDTWTSAITVSTGLVVTAEFNSISTSNTGQFVVATGSDLTQTSSIYLSTNYGVSYNILSSSTTFNWGSVTMSTSGQYIFATANYVYFSSNYGVTFSLMANSPDTGTPTSIAVNGVASYLTSVQFGGEIYETSSIFTPYPTLAPSAPPTLANMPSANPSAIRSLNPSEIPTSVPTIAPIVIPITSPTNSPITNPIPTLTPTRSPVASANPISDGSNSQSSSSEKKSSKGGVIAGVIIAIVVVLGAIGVYYYYSRSRKNIKNSEPLLDNTSSEFVYRHSDL